MKTLETISALLLGFEHANVRYVHWKSNNNINRALNGRDDLDILVHPDDAAIAERVLADLNIIRGESEKDGWQPNIYHYYGVDSRSNQLVHLHLHYSLTLGHDYHKNFTLPVTDWYLAGRVQYQGIYLPEPEKEFILFVIRVLIKSARSVVIAEFPASHIRRLLRPNTTAQNKLVLEIEHLLSLTDENAVKAALLSSGLPLEYDLFLDFSSLVKSGTNVHALRQAAAKTKSKLRTYRYTNELFSLTLATMRVNLVRVRNLWVKFSGARPKRKLPQFGGRIIAFIGGDGAGKSTNVSIAYKTLARHLSAVQIHIGKPKRSLIGIGCSFLSLIVGITGQRKLAVCFRHLALAYDRWGAFQSAKRYREAGAIVILDRLPHPSITTMDGPRIPSSEIGLLGKLSTIEQKIYSRIDGADLIVALKLDPEIACARRPDDDRETLLKRSGEIWKKNWDAEHMLMVDTGKMSFSEVERVVLERIWKELSCPFLRVELLGVTGSGKSTLATALAKQYSNTTTILGNRPKIFELAIPSLQALWLIGVPTTSRQVLMWKNLTYLFYFQKACSEKKITQTRPASHLVLDQGPLFKIVFAQQNGLFEQKAQIVERVLDSFQEINGIGFFLTTARDEAHRRILKRPLVTAARGPKLSHSEFEVFAEKYEAGYESLKNRLEQRIELSTEVAKSQVLESALEELRVFRGNL